MIKGSTGEFIYTLPVVIACSLLASRLVSMTFIPLLSYYLLKPKFEMPIEERRTKGFAARYYRLGPWAIEDPRKIMGGPPRVLVNGGAVVAPGWTPCCSQ